VEESLSRSAKAHFKHHQRFYAALVLGVLVLAATRAYDLPSRLIAAGDTFFASYLLMIVFVLGWTPESLRKRAAIEDEGIFLVVLIVLTAISCCCGSIVIILHQSHGKISLPLLLALAGAPLGWFTLHIVAAFHYANLYYSRGGAEPPAMETMKPPLQFPGGSDPTPWDFIYYSFVVGMTAQVSDVQVTASRMRRATLGHGIVSFFFNTVLIAMAVNAVVTIAT
jgi:uncharacterized membrane protein